MEKERKQILDILHSRQYDKELQTNILRTTRSQESSENIRKSGNDQFNAPFHNKHTHEKAWRFYSVSIAAAEPNSETLAIAYGNRSAILIHLSKYKECIIDIDRALNITKNNSLRIKLLLRKAKCLHSLESVESHSCLKKAEFLTNQITNDSVKATLKESVEKTKMLLKKHKKSFIEQEDKKAKVLKTLVRKHQINDFSSVKIQFSEEYGRHLVATKDIRIGDVIFIEKPYIQCINLANMHVYCSHCFNVCWTTISCNECSWAMFCSEECKKEAWEKYHDMECSIYACAKAKGNGTPQQLALRAIILGIKEYGNLENLKAALIAFDENTDIDKGFMQNGKINPLGLLTMYSLSRKISKKSLKQQEEETARIIKSVGLNTKWFGDDFDHSKASNYRKSERVVLFGTLFLTFSKIGQINGRQMWNHRNNPCYNNPGVMICPPKEECCSAGSYLAPVTSLLNHSCCPNARVCYGSNNTVIVYATLPIKKGEQIFDCYALQFHEEDIIKRKKILSKTYNLECKCIACEEKWPFGDDFLDLCNDNSNKSVSDIENYLFSKNAKLILSGVPGKEIEYKEKIISTLRDDIEIGLQRIPPPSFATTSLVHTLQKVYEKIYGLSVDIPEKCNNI